MNMTHDFAEVRARQVQEQARRKAVVDHTISGVTEFGETHPIESAADLMAEAYALLAVIENDVRTNSDYNGGGSTSPVVATALRGVGKLLAFGEMMARWADVPMPVSGEK